ncbi:MAG: DUF2062 domain-containing protein [Dissulfurimicrobium sp.]|uniref:DUF2062 domain-containing protein n=1 Tax=Dissulfurimicrobium sp. TaxID=2022436 RepID=UPI00404A79D7
MKGKWGGLSPVKTLRYYWFRLVRLKADPVVLARGVAIGVFVGLTPTIPLHTILITALCALLRGNIFAGIIANFLISNPLTIFIHYYAAWKIGVLLTGNHVSWDEVQTIVQVAHSSGFLEALRRISRASWEILVTMLAGGVVFALPFGVAAYFFYLYAARQRNRMKRYLKASNDR